VTNFSTPVGGESDGQVRVVDAGAHVNVHVDLQGDNVTDMIIQVTNIDTLTQRDFIL
jgi:hypothetical protein